MTRRDATLLLLVVVAFGATLAGGFGSATQLLGAGDMARLGGAWLPLADWTKEAQSWLGLDHPMIDRLAGLALHALAALLLFRVGVALGLPSRAAFVGAALFAVHPLAAATLATAPGRSTLLAATALLGALLAHLEARRRQLLGSSASPAAATAVALATIAFAAHPQALLLPVILLQIDRLRAWRVGRQLRWQHLGYAAALLVVWAPRLLAGAQPAAIDPLDNPLATVDPPARILSALQLAERSLAHVAAPFALSADYAFAQVRPLEPTAFAVLLAVGATLLTLAVSWWLARGRPPVAIGLLLAAATFLPVANLLTPVARALDDRSAYLPLAGLALALAGGWDALSTRLPKLAPMLASTAVAGLALLAIRYSWTYRHPIAVERQVARAAPRSVRGLVWRGNDRLAFGLVDDAERSFQHAVELVPRYVPARLGLARVALRRGDLAAAELQVREALELDPRSLPTLDLAAQITVARNDPAGAASIWRRRLEIEPGHAPTLSNLAILEWQSGRREAAIGLWRRAAQSPEAPPALLLNLARALDATGRNEEASSYRQRAARAGAPPAP